MWWTRRAWKAALAGLPLMAGLACLFFFRPYRSAAPPAETAWHKAQQALARDHFSRAMTHLREFLQTRPFHAEAHFLLARTARRQGDLLLWKEHLRRAEVLQWAPAELDLERRLVRTQLGADRDIDRTLLAYLDNYHSESGLILEAIVRGLLESYRLEEAVHWANRWIATRPEDYRGWLYRGRAFALHENRHQALADFRKAAEINATQSTVRLWLGGSLMITGQVAEALEQYRALLEDEPESSPALLGAAHCLAVLDQKLEARALLDSLLARQPEDAAALLIRARLDLDKDAAAALELLRRAEKVAPHDPEIAYTLALALRQLGRQEEAERYQQRHKQLHELTQQLEQARRRAAMTAADAAARHEVGALYQRLGDEEEALRWFQAALAVDASHRPTHQALADWFHHRGDVRKAEEHRRKASDK